MNEKEKLIQHFQNYGKSNSWLSIANQYNCYPFMSNKQKSDKVRKIYQSWSRSSKEFYAEPIRYKSNSEFPGISGTSFKIVLDKEWLGNPDFFTKNDLKPYTKGNPNNVLVVPDIHIPFEHPNALNFLRKQQEKYDCGKVIFIGDIIDGHAWSFHQKHGDSKSAREEYELALIKIQEWYKVFPEAMITIGNHDALFDRKVESAGISRRFLKPLNEIFNVPNWKFVNEYVYNDVLYTHGHGGGNAEKRVSQEFISTVQGHLHSESFVKYFAGRNKQLFAMQVGTMIDFDAYAFEYAKRGKKPILSCGVVLDNQPIIVPYND